MPSAPGGSLLQSVRRDIASMKTRGAGEIGRQAALALAGAAKAFRGKSLAEFRSRMREAATMLAAARPTAVSLRNGLNFVLAGAMTQKTLDAARREVVLRAERFATDVTLAKKRIAELAAKELSDAERILVHCHSTAALGALVEAQRQGKRPIVFATETRPFRQGLITSRFLKENGIDVTLIVDSAALHVMETQRVTRVLLGADAVAADGSLYNKIGTRQVTLAAKSLKIPVMVCAETFKFSPYTLEGEEVVIEERDAAEIVDAKELPGVKVHNPVFDRTPPEQVTVFVTDAGRVVPRDVAKFIRARFGGEKRWI